MKKLLIAAAAAATLTAPSAFAQSAFEGFYGQVGIGYEHNSLSSNSLNVVQKPGDPFSGTDGTTGAPNQSGGGFSGALGLGYTFSVAPKFLLGIGVDYSPLSVNTGNNLICNDCTTSSNYKVSNRFNAYLTPGFEIDKDKMVYLKAGYTMEQIKQNVGASANTFTNSLSASANANGYILGLGYKQLIDKNIYVFGEGNYMGYSSVTVNSTGVNPDGSTQATSQSTKPSAYQFLVGVGYKF